MLGVNGIFTYLNKAIILVYVDDFPIFARDEETVNEVVQVIEQICKVKNIGDASLLLEIELLKKKKNNKLYNLNCRQYIENYINKYHTVNP